MKPMTKQELFDAIIETEKQERLFRLAGHELLSAHWILERVKLRAQLFMVLQREALR